MTLIRRAGLLTVVLACALSSATTNGLASSGHVNIDTSVDVPAPMMESLGRGTISHSREKLSGRNYHVARATISATPEQVWSVLTDYSKATATVPHLKDIKVLTSDKNHKRVWFSVASLGGLWKFDYVLTLTETKPYRLDWRRESGAFKTNDGFWKLQPIENGAKTLITYAKFIDGGIFLPQMFVDGQLKKTMPEIIQSLRTAVTNSHHHKKIAERETLNVQRFHSAENVRVD